MKIIIMNLILKNNSMIFLIAFFLSSFMSINFINFQLLTFNF